jgi:hypothetical protein
MLHNVAERTMVQSGVGMQIPIPPLLQKVYFRHGYRFFESPPNCKISMATKWRTTDLPTLGQNSTFVIYKAELIKIATSK